MFELSTVFSTPNQQLTVTMKNHRIILTLLIAACSLSTTRPLSGEEATTEAASQKSVFLIGNSLTWDTVPSLLDGDVQWHVDCGKSLPFIFANPGMPCVKTSTLWPQALREKQYDIVSFQTHYGATLAEDVETISKWIQLQPQAVIVIHTGWAHHEKRAAEYASTEASGKMQHSPTYVGALLAELKKQFPDREFRQTRAIDLLDHIAADIKAGRAPLTDVVDLHRDAIHMKHDSGRYLMHNAMLHALGQPRSNRGFEKLDPSLKAYLDTVLDWLQTQKPE
jgi:hypothetical protein